ncbi:hypothetical protein DMN91_012765 [Ooceraea biroi]|uniref:BTB domain-containing protein n=1 Tax=Ooceraea biroi TaxID=2015173 RepID=A0A026W0Z6_OOCBI|nr:zinc finger and BTB domain-containing protein 47 [Ooceraea biroi]EZA49683.1 hypothetical protein X777_11769 [Ooceraea biroi]RLU14878.1 hypothetical protein DMN91_012765 [Ooceraea biroi]
MYGLYRAWFGGGATGAYPCLQDTFSPPDTVIRVGNEGEHQFVAHKGVLAAHSGYLKALLASASTTTTSSANLPYDPSCTTVTVSTANGQSQRPVTSVSVSSIGGEAFAPLLNYMYTGRLEVTLDNVYSVLLATHLLHMPGALEQCRAALLRLRAPPSLPTPPIPVPTSASTTTGSSPGVVGNILRPIPSRLVVGPPLCWPPTTPLAYPSAAPAPTMSHLPPSMQPLMQSTMPPSINIVSPREKQEQCTHYSSGEVSKSPRSSPIPHHKRQRLSSTRDSRTPEIVSTVSTLPFVAAAAAAFTAFAVTTGTTNPTTRTSSPSRSISPAPSSISVRTHSPVHRNSNKSAEREIQRERESEASSVRSCSDQHRRSSATVSIDDGAPSHNSNNANVAISEHDRARSSRRRARTSTTKETTSSTSTVFSVVYDIACCDGPVRFHRVLNENYSSTTSHPATHQQIRPQRNCPLTEGEDLSSENDENGGPGTRGNSVARSPSDSSNDGSNSNNSGCYTCGYCKHTFKSQYCYRKHAKRHLLPTRINETASGADPAPRQDTTRSRREVRLLDLNVQYYPCKICGCKFPSYYFVHKHRKLCHANEEERQGADASVAPNTLSRDADTSSTQDAP